MDKKKQILGGLNISRKTAQESMLWDFNKSNEIGLKINTCVLNSARWFRSYLIEWCQLIAWREIYFSENRWFDEIFSSYLPTSIMGEHLEYQRGVCAL